MVVVINSRQKTIVLNVHEKLVVALQMLADIGPHAATFS